MNTLSDNPIRIEGFLRGNRLVKCRIANKLALIVVVVINTIIPLTPVINATVSLGSPLGVALTNTSSGLTQVSGFAVANSSGYFSAAGSVFMCGIGLLKGVAVTLFSTVFLESNGWLRNGLRKKDAFYNYVGGLFNHTVVNYAPRLMWDNVVYKKSTEFLASLPDSPVVTIVKRIISTPFVFTILLLLNLRPDLLVALIRWIIYRLCQLWYHINERIGYWLGRRYHQLNNHHYAPNNESRNRRDSTLGGLIQLINVRSSRLPKDGLEDITVREFTRVLANIYREMEFLDTRERANLPGILLRLEALRWAQLNEEASTGMYPASLLAYPQGNRVKYPLALSNGPTESSDDGLIRWQKLRWQKCATKTIKKFLEQIRLNNPVALRVLLERLGEGITDPGNEVLDKTALFYPSMFTSVPLREIIVPGIARQFTWQETFTGTRLHKFLSLSTSGYFQGLPRRGIDRAVKNLMNDVLDVNASVRPSYADVSAVIIGYFNLKNITVNMPTASNRAKIRMVVASLKEGELYHAVNNRLRFQTMREIQALREHFKNRQTRQGVDKNRARREVVQQRLLRVISKNLDKTRESRLSAIAFITKLDAMSQFGAPETLLRRPGMIGRIKAKRLNVIYNRPYHELSSLWRVAYSFEPPLNYRDGISKAFGQYLKTEILNKPVSTRLDVNSEQRWSNYIISADPEGYARFVKAKQLDRLAFITITRQKMHERVRFFTDVNFMKCLKLSELQAMRCQLALEIEALKKVQQAIIASRMAQLRPDIEEGRMHELVLTSRLEQEVRRQTILVRKADDETELIVRAPITVTMRVGEIGMLDKLEAVEAKVNTEKAMLDLLRQTCMDAEGLCFMVQEACLKAKRLSVYLKEYSRCIAAIKDELAVLKQLTGRIRALKAANESTVHLQEALTSSMLKMSALRRYEADLARKQIPAYLANPFSTAVESMEMTTDKTELRLMRSFLVDLSTERLALVPAESDVDRRTGIENAALRISSAQRILGNNRETLLTLEALSFISDCELKKLITVMVRQRKRHLQECLNNSQRSSIDVENTYCKIRRLTDMIAYAQCEVRKREASSIQLTESANAWEQLATASKKDLPVASRTDEALWASLDLTDLIG